MIELVTNPVITESGVVNNLFAGFDAVEFGFKREDLAVTSVGQGIDNQILINISTDLSSYLEIGDPVYLSSEGLTYTYDIAGRVVAITSSTITIDQDFIEAASGGYINYKKGYYLECELVRPDNEDIKVLPFSLIDDGDNAGNITIDVSIANDLNTQMIAFANGELTDTRTVFKLKYREVYDLATSSYTTIENVIVLGYATEQPDVETFLNDFDEPVIWKGYPFGVILAHTNENSDNTGLFFTYDELDINQNVLVSDKSLGSALSTWQGFIFINIDKDISYNAQTKYIKIKANYSVIKFFSPAFFASNFFES